MRRPSETAGDIGRWRGHVGEQKPPRRTTATVQRQCRNSAIARRCGPDQLSPTAGRHQQDGIWPGVRPAVPPAVDIFAERNGEKPVETVSLGTQYASDQKSGCEADGG